MKKRIKKRLCLLLALSLLPLTLCSCGGPTMERQTFPICMSIDVTKDDKIQIGIQAPQSGKSGGEATTLEYDLLSATGDNIASTLFVLASSTPYPINYCQLQVCIVSYQLAATTDLRAMLSELSQLPTIRPTAMVLVSMGNAFQVMEKQIPDFGMRLSTHLQQLFQRMKIEHILPNSTLAAVVREQGEGRRDQLLCVCAINPQLIPKEEKKGESGGGGGGGGGGSSGGGGSGGGAAAPVISIGEPWSDAILPEDIVAGMLPRTGSNLVEYLGSVTISDGRVSGLLTASETQIVLRALEESIRRVAIHGEQLQLQILIKPNTELDQNRGMLQAAMEKLQALGCDALGFGGISARAFWTDAAWEAFDFKHQYPMADVVIGEE